MMPQPAAPRAPCAPECGRPKNQVYFPLFAFSIPTLKEYGTGLSALWNVVQISLCVLPPWQVCSMCWAMEHVAPIATEAHSLEGVCLWNDKAVGVCFRSQMEFKLWAGELSGETILAGAWLSAWMSSVLAALSPRCVDFVVVLFFLKQDLSLSGFFCKVIGLPMGTIKQQICSLPSAWKSIFERPLWLWASEMFAELWICLKYCAR